MENNTTITIRLPEELKDKIVFCALTSGCTASEVVRTIVADFFDWQKDKEQSEVTK
jgi:predicted transcriptional regulator